MMMIHIQINLNLANKQSQNRNFFYRNPTVDASTKTEKGNTPDVVTEINRLP